MQLHATSPDLHLTNVVSRSIPATAISVNRGHIALSTEAARPPVYLLRAQRPKILREQLLEDVPVHIRQPPLDAIVAKSEPLMIEPEQV